MDVSKNLESQFGTFNKTSLSEDIVQELLSLIRERKLRPGDKLPPERQLASLMEISRPPLREALRALAIMNVVEIRQGDGTYVTSLEPNLLLEHLDFVFSLGDSAFLKLFEARKVVECGIAELAAQHISDDELTHIEAVLEESMQNVDNHEVFLETDLELHDKIKQAACNPILGRFMDSISYLGRASRNRTVEIPGVPERAVEDHRIIVQALKQRDPEAARQAMFEHLNNVEQRLKQIDVNEAERDSLHQDAGG